MEILNYYEDTFDTLLTILICIFSMQHCCCLFVSYSQGFNLICQHFRTSSLKYGLRMEQLIQQWKIRSLRKPTTQHFSLMNGLYHKWSGKTFWYRKWQPWTFKLKAKTHKLIGKSKIRLILKLIFIVYLFDRKLIYLYFLKT